MDFQRTYSVFLADDHELVRIGLRYYLQSEPMFEVVGEASNGLEAFDKIVYYRPDIAVVDVLMPIVNGIELLNEIRAEKLKTRFLLITAMEDVLDLKALFLNDADGVVSKNISRNDFISSLRNIIIFGQKVVSVGIFQKLPFKLYFKFNGLRNENVLSFSLLQKKILDKRLQGKLIYEIAKDLNISLREINYELEKLGDFSEHPCFIEHYFY